MNIVKALVDAFNKRRRPLLLVGPSPNIVIMMYIDVKIITIYYRWPRPRRRLAPSAGLRVGRVWATSCAGWVAASTAAPATWSWQSPSATPASNLPCLVFVVKQNCVLHINRDLNRLFALCLSQRFSPAGFAFPTYNFGCALMGDIFLDQDLVQNCVSWHVTISWHILWCFSSIQ